MKPKAGMQLCPQGKCHGDGRWKEETALLNRLETKIHGRFCSKPVQFILFGILIPIKIGLDVAMIYFGATKLDLCPMEPRIPVFITVFGSTLLAMTLLKVALKIRYHFKNPDSPLSPVDYLLRFDLGLVFLFNVVWAVVLASVVIPVDRPDYVNTASPTYCDKTVYIFALKTAIGHVVVFATILIIGCCCYAYLRQSVGRKKLDDTQPSTEQTA